MYKTKHRVKKIPQSEDTGRRHTREREQNQLLATPRRTTIILFNKHPNIYSYWSSKQCWDVYEPWVRMLQAVNKVLSVRDLWLSSLLLKWHGVFASPQSCQATRASVSHFHTISEIWGRLLGSPQWSGLWSSFLVPILGLLRVGLCVSEVIGWV